MTALIDRAAEEAAIAAHIAARGITRLPEVDPVERALEIWRAQREDGGTQTTFVRLHKKRGRPRKNPDGAGSGTAPKTLADKPRQAGLREDEGTAALAVAQEYLEERSGTAREAPSTCMWDGNCAVGAQPAAQIIATLAYALWEMEGRPHGADMRHWLTAEAIMCGHYREIAQKAGG